MIVLTNLKDCIDKSWDLIRQLSDTKILNSKMLAKKKKTGKEHLKRDFTWNSIMK